MKFFYKKIFCPTCIIFTAITVLFSALLSWSSTEMYLPFMNISNILQVLAYSFIVSVCGSLFTVMPYIPALGIDFVGVIGGFGVIFLLIGKHYSTESGAWAILGALALIYIVVAVIVSIIRAVKNKGKEEKTYTRQFR